MAGRRRGDRPPAGAPRSERGERRRRGQLPAPRRGVRGVPLRHRPAQGGRAHLEEGELGRRADRVGASGRGGRDMNLPTLVDTFGRVHNNLRISVTDRCNLRCTYCMPEEVTFLDRAELLTFEEITSFVRVAAPLGIDKIRLTGGEPLMRRGLERLVAMVVGVPGIKDVGLRSEERRVERV